MSCRHVAGRRRFRSRSTVKRFSPELTHGAHRSQIGTLVEQRGVDDGWREVGEALAGQDVLERLTLITTTAPIFTVSIISWRPEERSASLIAALLLAQCLFVAAVFFFSHPLRREITKIRGWMQFIRVYLAGLTQAYLSRI